MTRASRADAAERAQGLVAAAHPPRKPARENDPKTHGASHCAPAAGPVKDASHERPRQHVYEPLQPRRKEFAAAVTPMNGCGAFCAEHSLGAAINAKKRS